MLSPVVADGRKLRRGFTTGMCAAAAAKGATIMLFQDDWPDEVDVATPAGPVLRLKICSREKDGNHARCCVVKDAGDDPDATNGLAVCATARKTAAGVRIKGGAGVGVVTRPGLAVAPGHPAINPVPRQLIENEVKKVLPAGAGVEITISVPGGEQAAAKTMNPRLGILGGISILGTTGIVEPMSEKAFKTSLVPQISQALALGYRDVVFAPGRRAERWAVEKYGLPSGAVVQVSNFVGYLLAEGARLGVKRVLLFGRLGKLGKVAAGVFHTHSRVADARREILTAHAALAGANRSVLGQIWQSATAEEAAQIIQEHGLGFLFSRLAEAASQRAREYVRGELFVGTVLTSLDGEILGLDAGAKEIGAELGWPGWPELK